METFEQVVELSPLIRKDQVLYRQGDPFRSVFAVKQGAFKGILHDIDGNAHITGFHMPGEVIGFDGIAADAYQCDLIALDDSRVCELPAGRLDEMSLRFPALRHEISKISSRSNNSLQQMLMLVGKRPVEERLAVFLLNMVDRYRLRNIQSQRFQLPMSRHDIANYLGMAPETLSRQFRRFEKREMVNVSGKDCEVLDEPALRALAQACGAAFNTNRLAG